MDPEWAAYLDLQVSFLELVGRWMAKRQMSRAMLAQRLGWSGRRIVALLDGYDDPTVRDMADVAWALDLRLGMDWRPL